MSMTTSRKMLRTLVRAKEAKETKKKTLKTKAYLNPDRDEDLKEYLNRKDFHTFELELLMNDYDSGLDE
jgi:hypothetical protein